MDAPPRQTDRNPGPQIVRVADLPGTRSKTFALRPDAAQCAALMDRFPVYRAVGKLRLRRNADPDGGGGWRP